MSKLLDKPYLQDALTLAPELLGKILVHESEEGITSGIIVETEAYLGPGDRAAHTWNNRRTRRTDVVFGAGGYAYVYMVYGKYYCFNVTANVKGKPECVLVRALEPLDGTSIMMARRNTRRMLSLCSGPGRMCSAMGITRELYGEDLCGGRLYILENVYPKMKAVASTRIGIDYAGDSREYLWRFFIDGNKYVSQAK